jgi:hypothetical protein
MLGSERTARWANLRMVMSRRRRDKRRESACMTHAVTGEENAQSMFRNLEICHAHIDGRHHFEEGNDQSR